MPRPRIILSRSALCHGIGAALFTLSLGCLAEPPPSGYLLDGNGQPVTTRHGGCLQIGRLDVTDKHSECYQRAHAVVHHHIEPLPRDEFGFMLPPAPAVAPTHDSAQQTPSHPQPVAPRYTTRTLHFTTPVAFGVSRAGLSAQNRDALFAFINSLEQYRGVESIHVTGHTDLSGSRHYNTWLAGKRAESVRIRLLSMGVDPRTLVTKGVMGGGRNVEIVVVVRVPVNDSNDGSDPGHIAAP